MNKKNAMAIVAVVFILFATLPTALADTVVGSEAQAVAFLNGESFGFQDVGHNMLAQVTVAVGDLNGSATLTIDDTGGQLVFVPTTAGAVNVTSWTGANLYASVDTSGYADNKQLYNFSSSNPLTLSWLYSSTDTNPGNPGNPNQNNNPTTTPTPQPSPNQNGGPGPSPHLTPQPQFDFIEAIKNVPGWAVWGIVGLMGVVLVAGIINGQRAKGARNSSKVPRRKFQGVST